MIPIEMHPASRVLRLLAVCVVFLAALAGCSPADTGPQGQQQPGKASEITVTDIVGRTVKVKAPVESVLLGEGRQIYVVAVLELEDPFKRVVGWPDDFRLTDQRQSQGRRTLLPATNTSLSQRGTEEDPQEEVNNDPDAASGGDLLPGTPPSLRRDRCSCPGGEGKGADLCHGQGARPCRVT